MLRPSQTRLGSGLIKALPVSFAAVRRTGWPVASVLDVSDAGCGFTDQIRAGIFDPFFTTKGVGRGLGLSAVQGFIHGHGGNISVVSRPGRGSRFEIFLPSANHSEQVRSDGENQLRGTAQRVSREQFR